jgi:hypothetical protein
MTGVALNASPATVTALRTMTVEEIESSTAEISFVVDDLLMTGGTTLLVGPPKLGKSTLAKQIAVSVSKGQPVIDRAVESGRVLYMQLEEHPKWTTQTLRKMGHTNGEPLFLITERPSMATEALEKTIEAYPETRLLVLDMMNKVVSIEDLNNYMEVTSKLEPLTLLARKTGVSILLLHHGKKGGNGDVINDALGSTALTGNVDIIAGLSRDESGTTWLKTASRVGRPVNVPLQWDEQTHLYSIMSGDNLAMARSVARNTAAARAMAGVAEHNQRIKQESETAKTSALVAYLREQPDQSAPMMKLQGQVGGHAAQFRQLVNKLAADGLLEVVKNGRTKTVLLCHTNTDNPEAAL